MSTHGLIAMEEGDGSYRGIYVHDTGYRTGRKLAESYSKRAKVRKVIGLGALSLLGRDIGGAHDFMHHDYQSDTCLAYGRDRGERGDHVRPQPYADISHLMQGAMSMDAEAVYIFTRANVWVQVQTVVTYELHEVTS